MKKNWLSSIVLWALGLIFFSAALLVVRVQFEKRLGNYAVSSDILAGTSRMEQLP